MRLGAFFEAIGPYLEGRPGVDHAAITRALWGESGGGSDGERLAIYERFCRTHRFEVLALFAATRAAVIGSDGGEELWAQLVADFFAAHPMRHFELFENGADFPSWLAAQAEARALPPWLPEVADAEWWTWRAEYGPDPEGPEGAPLDGEGPLRIAHHVELRPYGHHVASWLDEDESQRGDAPEAGEEVAVVWRDHDLDGRCAAASPVELAVLKMVSESMTAQALARATGLPESAIAATVNDLHAAGILAGALRA